MARLLDRFISWCVGAEVDRVQDAEMPMTYCPFCGEPAPADDLWAQKAHMEAEHPEAIEERLKAAGFRVKPDGSVEDMLT